MSYDNIIQFYNINIDVIFLQFENFNSKTRSQGESQGGADACQGGRPGAPCPGAATVCVLCCFW